MAELDEQEENGKAGLAFHERNLRTLILSLLRREGGMPRALLSEKLQATPAMLTRCVQRMQTEGLVHDEGRSKGRGGRMCTNVALNPNAGIAIGVEYNPQEIVTVAVNFACHVEKQISFPVPEKARKGSPDELLPALFKAIRETYQTVAGSRPLLGIAAVDPGVIDTSTGVTISSNALPQWAHVPIRQKLADEFNVPIYLSNTVNAILAAVDRCELKRRYTDFIYLEYRAGVACGIKGNNRQVLGSRGRAGELTLSGGHRSSYMEQPLGFSGIQQRLCEAGHPAFQNPVPQAGALILSLAAQGDELVARILSEIWHQLGQACGNLANILDPQAIVLDPHFNQADAGSLAAFKQGMKEQTVAPHIDLIVSQLKESSAPVGAALILLENLTSSHTLL